MIKVKDLAYAAGIVDGEGSIMLSYIHTSGKNTFIPVIAVVNTNLKLLKWLQSMFGGNVNNQRKDNPNHKDSYLWSHRYKSCVEILKSIYPYLKLKRKQAEVIFKVVKVKKKYRVQGIYGTSKQAQRCLLTLTSKMHKLNKRGN